MFGSLAIEPTNACNLKCNICYTQESGRKQCFLPFDLYKRIIDEVITLKIGCIGLNHGGEPMVHPLFANMVEYATKKGQHIQFSTNGTLLTKEIIDAIISGYVDKINFSIHDDLDTVKNNIIKIRDRRSTARKPKLTATINVGEFNDKMIDHLKDMFSHLVDQVGIQSMITNMKWSKIPMGKKVIHHRYCRQSQGYMAVLCDGSVTICCHDVGGKMAFGNVASDGLVGTWNSRYYVDLRRDMSMNKFPKGSICEHCNVSGRVAILEII